PLQITFRYSPSDLRRRYSIVQFSRAANDCSHCTRVLSRSSRCTFSSQPYPSSCSIVRPVKSSHVLLKKVACPSERDATIITGAVSARLRKRRSLCLNAVSARLRCRKDPESQNVTPNAKARPEPAQ